MIKEKLVGLIVSLLGDPVSKMGVALLGGLQLLSSVTIIDQPLTKLGWYAIIATLAVNIFVKLVNEGIKMHKYYFIEYRKAKKQIDSDQTTPHETDDK